MGTTYDGSLNEIRKATAAPSSNLCLCEQGISNAAPSTPYFSSNSRFCVHHQARKWNISYLVYHCSDNGPYDALQAERDGEAPMPTISQPHGCNKPRVMELLNGCTAYGTINSCENLVDSLLAIGMLELELPGELPTVTRVVR